MSEDQDQKEFNGESIDISQIIEDLKNNRIPDLNERQIKKLFSELDVSALNDLFNDSVKNLFDFMLKLGNSLDLNKILDIFQKKDLQKNKSNP